MGKRNQRLWTAVLLLAMLAIALALLSTWKNNPGKKDTDTAARAEQETKPESQEGVHAAPTEDEEQKIAEEPEETAQEVSVVIAGDVLLSNYVLQNYQASGISGVLDEGLLAELGNADIALVNEEFPFSTRGSQAEDKQFTFRVDPKYVSVFQDMGVDMVTIANNHVLDYGDKALEDTMDTLEQGGILYAGAGMDKERAMRLQVMEVGGMRIGLLAASRVIPVTSWNIENHQPGLLCTYDPSLLLEAIQQSRAQCDYLMVYAHWGIERNTVPEEYQRTLAKQYIDAGADAVIGSHPHVLQGIEYYEGKPIFYSLGNFIFNQSIEETMAIRLVIRGGEEDAVEVRILPAHASNAKTELLDEGDRAGFYRNLEEISYRVSIDADGVVTPWVLVE